LKLKQVPSPYLLLTFIFSVPPFNYLTSCSEIIRPNPIPLGLTWCVLSVWKAVNSFLRSSSLIPTPVSLIENLKNLSSSGYTLIIIPPLFVNLKAFPIKFIRI
jgi:hypothetical protein